MANLERDGGGYELRGRRGWIHPKDLKDLARFLGDRAKHDLQRLGETRQLDRENVALPGRRGSIWVYRINARGAAWAKVDPPADLGPPENCGPRTIFSGAQWLALQAMRAALTQQSPLRFVTREAGWRTIAEIRETPLVRRSDTQIMPEDVYHLERWGLIERRTGEGVARERPLIFYRVTLLGMSVERLALHTPDPAPGKGTATAAEDPPRL
jgi:hypothetical protein